MRGSHPLPRASPTRPLPSHDPATTARRAGTRALAAIASEGESQCITLLGQPGAGKTFLAQRLLQQLCAGAPGAAGLEEPLSRGNALLDFFGSARMADVVSAPSAASAAAATAATPRGVRTATEAAASQPLPAHVASCFCRASLLYFRADGRVAVARVQTALLARGRLLPEPPPPGGTVAQREGLLCLRALLAIEPSLAAELELAEAASSRYVGGAPRPRARSPPHRAPLSLPVHPRFSPPPRHPSRRCLAQERRRRTTRRACARRSQR